MKIAYLSFNEFPSKYAHAVQIMRMCEAFSEEGHQVTLFAQKSLHYTSDESLFFEYGVNYKFNIVWLELNNLKNHYLFFLLKIIYKIKNEYDVYFARYHYPVLVCYFFRLKCVYEIHNIPISKSWKLSIQLFKNTKFIEYVFIAHKLAELYKKLYRINESQIIVQHDGALLRELVGESIDADLEDLFCKETKNILYIGSFYKGRGIDLVVKLAKSNTEYNFICIGGNQKDFNETDLPNIKFHNRVDNRIVPFLLKKADILLMPYSRITTIEGKNNTADFCSPMKLGEYLASGKPIISSALPSLMEVLIDKENALLYEPDNYEELNLKFNTLVVDNILQIKLGQAALQTATKISWNSRVKEIVRFLC